MNPQLKHFSPLGLSGGNIVPRIDTDLVFPNWTIDQLGNASFTSISGTATGITSLGSIDIHSDVDTVTTPPAVNDVLSWDGVNWVPSQSAVQVSIGDLVNSGTVGSVLFVGAGGVLQQDNTNLFWDNTNNALGIDTAPHASSHLHVSEGAGAIKKGFMPPKMTSAQMSGNIFNSAGIDGLVGYDTTLSKPFYVDETTPLQTSWYSYESVTIAFGRNGNVDGAYLRYGGNATNAGTGWVAPHAGEIKELTAIETGGNPTKAIDIRVYDTANVLQTSTTINLVGSRYTNLNQNITFNAGWRVNVFVQNVGTPASNLAVTMQAKWKHVIIV